jgi:hypothetical protein
MYLLINNSFLFTIEIVNFTYQIIDIFRFNNRPIEDWDTSEIKDMAELFKNQRKCNPSIAKWDVSKVSDFVSEYL